MKFQVIDFADRKNFDFDLANKAFEMWKETYEPIVAAAGETLPVDYFWKSRLALVLTGEDGIIGFCLSNFIDFRSAGVSGLSYLNPASDIVKQRFQNDSKKILTVEWVTVAPALRARFSKVQYVDIIMGLSFCYMRDAGFDCAMGFSRTDQKANKIVQKFGGDQLELTQRHGIECGVMVMEQSKLIAHPISKTQAAIDEIYSAYSGTVRKEKAA